ncbi:MAG: hypothetical protein JWQ66_2926 [Mucilaginibacter sp.]|nr:hypothetical protein [Mucilaginibacter sp.]
MTTSKEMFMDMRQEQTEAIEYVPTKKSIYNISSDYMRLMDEIESNEGELTEDTESRLAITIDELENKAVSYGYIIRQYDFEMEQIAVEIARLNKISKGKLRIQSDLKNRISEAMLHFNMPKIQKNNLTLSFRKSEQLMIDEGAKVPKKFIKISEPVESVDKKALKEAVQSDEVKIEGIFILENQNLQIK